MLSGGRDSACLLHLAARAFGSVRALHVDHGLRPDSGARRRRVPGAVRRARSRARRRARAGRRRRPATSRPGRATSAWPRRPAHAGGTPVAAGPHRHRSGRDRPLPPGLLARPPRAARDARRQRAGWLPPRAAAARLLARGHARATAKITAWRSSTTPATPAAAFARARVRHGLAPALAAVHPDAERNVLRTAAILRDEAEVLDGLVAAETDGGARSPSSACARSRPPWPGSSSRPWPTTRPAARCPAPRRGPTRSSRSGPARSTSAAACAPASAAGSSPSSPPRDRRRSGEPVA